MLFGRCGCCFGPVTTVGCLPCSTTRTYCGSCGALTQCGCGKAFDHECPNFIVVPVTVVPIEPTGIVPDGFVTETGVLLN